MSRQPEVKQYLTPRERVGSRRRLQFILRRTVSAAADSPEHTWKVDLVSLNATEAETEAVVVSFDNKVLYLAYIFL